MLCRATDNTDAVKGGCPRHAGFTLLEVVIVAAILSIAAALALPMLRDTNLAQLRSGANLVIADLGYAQMESIAHASNPRVVTFDTSSNSYWIASQASPDTPITNPFDQQPYRVTFGCGRACALAGVTLSAVSVGTDNQLEFGPYGQLDQTSNATITLKSGPHSIVITVDATTGETSAGFLQ